MTLERGAGTLFLGTRLSSDGASFLALNDHSLQFYHCVLVLGVVAGFRLHAIIIVIIIIIIVILNFADLVLPV